MSTDIICPNTSRSCERNCWQRCAPIDAPIFELCERCGSEGRIYVSDGRDHDGSPRERDLGECSTCKGEGIVCMPGIPRTKWDDFEMFDYFDGAFEALFSPPQGQQNEGAES